MFFPSPTRTYLRCTSNSSTLAKLHAIPPLLHPRLQSKVLTTKMTTDPRSHACAVATSTSAAKSTRGSPVYTLAYELQDIEAKNSAVEAVISKRTHEAGTTAPGENWLPSDDVIQYIYKTTKGHNAARQALVDCYAYYCQPSSPFIRSAIRDGRYHRKFLLDLADTLM